MKDNDIAREAGVAEPEPDTPEEGIKSVGDTHISIRNLAGQSMTEDTRARSLSDLDYDQEQRVKALQAAREIVLSRAAFSSSVPNISDLMRVARYIVTGQDPWDTGTMYVVPEADHPWSLGTSASDDAAE